MGDWPALTDHMVDDDDSVLIQVSSIRQKTFRLYSEPIISLTVPTNYFGSMFVNHYRHKDRSIFVHFCIVHISHKVYCVQPSIGSLLKMFENKKKNFNRCTLADIFATNYNF